jgi:hypothetical protein
MGTVLTFLTPPTRRRAAALPLFPADIRPFPLTRYAGEVDRLARHMRSLSTTAQRADAMVHFITVQWNRLCDIGAHEPAVLQTLIQFADAVWLEVGQLERGGVA